MEREEEGIMGEAREGRLEKEEGENIVVVGREREEVEEVDEGEEEG